MCIHKSSLLCTLIIPAADASERGLSTHGAAILSANSLISLSLNNETNFGLEIPQDLARILMANLSRKYLPVV